LTMKIVFLATMAALVVLAKSTPALDSPSFDIPESRDYWPNCRAASGYPRFKAFCTGKYGDTGGGVCPSPYCFRLGGGSSNGGGSCRDKRSDCAKYKWACKSAASWANKNCAKTCGKCGGGGSNPPPPPPPIPPGGGNNNNNGDCGRKPAGIVGGTEATPYSIPWQVGLVSPGGNRPFCGGTLISDRHVLTAAHCTGGGRRKIDVIVGEHSVTSSSDGTRHTVCRVVNHPRYKNPSGQNNDFSILHLDKPVQIGRRAVPACLATSSMGGSFLVGKKMTVSGWGTTSSGGSTALRLRHVSVPGVSNSQCKRAYSSLTDAMLCAAEAGGGVDSCQGDSGGPLTYTTGGKTYLVGVVSFGIGCAKPGYPGVYARVTKEIGWINSELNKTC